MENICITTVGRRKCAISRLFLIKGTGKIKINGKEYKEYFNTPILIEKIFNLIKLIDTNKLDIIINVYGGGITGQSEAVRLSIARAFCILNYDNRRIFKSNGYLRRDPRIVERKKFGHKKARKKFQFSKR